jgi:protein-L-isoaspartate(D-aspartate) O-methyltransferase
MLRFAGACTKDGAILQAAPPRRFFAGQPMSGFLTARQRMVDGQVRTSDVTDRRILDAMLTLPREQFVPEDKQGLAYLDLDLDVAEAGSAKRFLITPMLTAKLAQAAEIAATDKVLVVGCATGYAAALVAMLGASVTATESDSRLVEKGKTILSALGKNVALRVAGAADGEPAGAPYDVIMLNGATEVVPEKLYQQLRDGGGRLVGVFAMTMPSRAVIAGRWHGEVGDRPLFDAAAPTLPGLERVPQFVF